ncbi:hypothetical protein Taro_017087 [Colocasia esculenta]|uniref:PWWP domain-containing protein n=1 Tax=Colocasia esculenta TaxID=4460 RepID=A0A843US97_COLES|nr:hypothetical protein [Colocasia esculenta]
MPPGRRKGGNRGEAKGQLRLGDLVLAKVKGFPAWPAKISRPEDWDRLPDPKKYFVHFFGTSEIAFVAPADIQVFTDETKSKLLARSRGKCSKDFGRAVEEICEAFERMHKKGSESSDRPREEIDTSKFSSFCSKTTAIDDGNLIETSKSEDQEEIHKQKAQANEEGSHDELPESGHSSQDQDGAFSSDVKEKGSDSNHGTETPLPSVKKEHRSSDDSTRILRGGKGPTFKSSSKISSLKSERSPSTDHDIRKENGVTVCSEEENADSKPKASDMDRPPDPFEGREGFGDHGAVDLVPEPKRRGTVKPLKKYASQKHPQDNSYEELHGFPKFEGQLKDELGDKTVHLLDKGGEASPCSPIQNADDGREKVSKSSTRSRKPPVGKTKLSPDQSHKKSKLDASKKEDIERSVSFADHIKKKNQVSRKRHKMDISEESQPPKRPRLIDDVDKKSRRSDMSDSSGNRDKPSKQASIPSTKSAKHILSTEDSLRGDSCQSLDAMTKATKGAEDERSSNLLKKDMPISDHKKSPVHTHTRRRTFRINDDEDNEVRRTPVHRESTSILMATVSNVSAVVSSSQVQAENPANSQPSTSYTPNGKLDLAKLDEKTCKDKSSPGKLESPLKQTLGQTEERKPMEAMEPVGKHLSPSPGRQEDLRISSREGRMNTKSSRPVSVAKPIEQKMTKAEVKTSSAALKAKVVSSKPLAGSSDNLNHSYNHATQKTKPSSLEKVKSTQKANLQKSTLMENRSDINFSAERSLDKSSSLGERFLATDDRVGNSMSESKFSDSNTSMKHLIAVAQAKRRQAHSQGLAYDRMIGVASTPSVIQERSPSPLSASQPISAMNFVQKDIVESFPPTSFTSPSTIAQNCISVGYMETDEHERAVSPGVLPHGGSLSGGTEAAVARDALEGMIETLSRTKESIGRATRLAIDCAKYGMACEVRVYSF